MMQIIMALIISFSFFLILLESSFISELYGEDLVIDEKVHITISKNNDTLVVPAKIGINPTLWKDHSLDYYSFDPTINSPLNTKHYDGIIHIESIHDREFTLDNFLDVWGFDKSKIKSIFCDDRKVCDSTVTLTDGQNLTLELKGDSSQNDFTKYEDSKISLEYPSNWNLNISSNLPQGYENEPLSSNETFRNIIELAPKEFEYMQTPFFSILINEIDPNMTEIDEYYKNYYHRLLKADENTFPHFIRYNITEIDGNLAYQIFLNTTLVAEPGYSATGNKVTQKGFHIWTIKDGYFYDISFKAFNSVYKNYSSVIDIMTRSIQIK